MYIGENIGKNDSFKSRSFFMCILGIVMAISFFTYGDIAFADDVDLKNDEEEILQLHEDMEPILHVDSGWMYQDVVRYVGWGLLKLLILITSYFERSVDAILSWNTFFQSSQVTALMNKLTPFIMGLFLISLIYVGYLIMFNKLEKRNEVFLNVIMAFLLIFIVPTAMPYLDDVFKIGKETLDGAEGAELLMSDSIIKTNVADIKHYEQQGFNFENVPKPLSKVEEGQSSSGGGSANFLRGNKITSYKDVAIAEKIDLQAEDGWFPWTTGEYRKDLEKNNTLAFDLFRTRAVPDGEGNMRLKTLAKNRIPATSLGQEAYYRYHINWGTAIFTYAIVAFALAVTVLKIARVIFELAFHGIFVMAVSATDLTGGQRTKKVVTEIVSSFAVLLVMVLIVKLFIYYTNWTIGLSGSIGSIASILMLLAGAWALLDAPDIVSRVLGIDAGLRSGWQTMMGAYAGAKMIGGGAKGLAKGLGAGAKGASSAAQFGKGLFGKSPVKEGSKDIKPMPDSKGADNSIGSKDAEGKGADSSKKGQSSSIPEQHKSPEGGGSIPSGGGSEVEGATDGGNDDKGSIPDSSEFISPNDNPYNKGYGIRSGSQAGQRSADRKARAYNSGVNARQKLMGAGSAASAVGMLGARFLRNPVQSTKNLAGMGMARASQMNESMQAMPSAIASNVSQAVGGFNQASKVPIGQSSSQGVATDNVEIDSAMQQQDVSASSVAIPSRMNTIGNPKEGRSMKVTQSGIEKIQRSVNATQKNGGTINTSQGTVNVQTPQVQSSSGMVQDNVEMVSSMQQAATSSSTSIPARMNTTGNPKEGRSMKVTQSGIEKVQRSANVTQKNGGTINTSQGTVNVQTPQVQSSGSMVQDNVEIVSSMKQQDVTSSSTSVPPRMNSVSSPKTGRSMKVTQSGIEKVQRSANVTQKNGGTINTSQGTVNFKSPQQTSSNVVQDKVEVNTSTKQQEVSSGSTVIPKTFNRMSSPKAGRSVKFTQNTVDNVKRTVDVMQKDGGTINTSQGKVNITQPKMQKESRTIVQDTSNVIDKKSSKRNIDDK